MGSPKCGYDVSVTQLRFRIIVARLWTECAVMRTVQRKESGTLLAGAYRGVFTVPHIISCTHQGTVIK